MLEHLKNDFNKTTTSNGASAYKSTNSDVLDLFSQGGSYRERSDEDVVRLFSKAFAEDNLLAMRTLFYLRDVRGGAGERRFFNLCLEYLAKHNKNALKKNLNLIPEFGRYDDLLVLLETSLKNDVVRLIRNQLNKDNSSDKPSLLGKWLPSENASSKTTKNYAKIIRSSLGLSSQKYRKMLSKLRKKINIVESKMSQNNWDKIDYSTLPSHASMKYREAFYRNDSIRYMEFLEKLESGEETVNAGALYPVNIVDKILNKRESEQDTKLFDGQWNNLPDLFEGKHENSMVMADVSGSMWGTPISVSISLAMYIAERNKGVYHNHFMTFSSYPKLVSIKGDDIVDKVMNICQADWGMSTNIERAMMKLLDVAVENDLDNKNMIKKIYIISDMQFDTCSQGFDRHIFEELEMMFELHGYDMPQIVFWNVNASLSNTPFTRDSSGVALVSGYSPNVLKYLLGEKEYNPYDIMLDVVNSERYKDITV